MDQTDRRMFARRAWHFVAAAVLLAGCSTTPLTPPRVLDDAPTQAMIETLEQAARSEPDAPPPGDVAPEVLEVLEEAARTSAESDERFDVSVAAVPAAEFFRGLVAGTRFNVAVHPEVSGAITLDLTDVTISEVMNVVRDVYGYEFVRDGRLFTVFPDAMRTEIFQVDYLNVDRNGRSEMQVSAGKLGNGSNNNGGGNNVSVWRSHLSDPC